MQVSREKAAENRSGSWKSPHTCFASVDPMARRRRHHARRRSHAWRILWSLQNHKDDLASAAPTRHEAKMPFFSVTIDVTDRLELRARLVVMRLPQFGSSPALPA